MQLTVSDTGQGITKDFLPHVFERFRQADGSAARMHGGLGLGLSIAKSIVELHGGTIQAHSDGPGKGATFVVLLPRALVRADPAIPPAPAAFPARGAADPLCPPELSGLRVAIVDDEPDGLQLLAAILEVCGANVRTARSAPEGFELVRGFQPDVLISDIGMPGEDGYAFIRRVRALPPHEGGQTYAIALTAFARTEDRTRALTAGFHAHVSKPVEPAELLAVIASLVRRPGHG